MTRRDALKNMAYLCFGAAASWLGIKTSYLKKAALKTDNFIIKNKAGKNMKVLLINGSPHKEGCTYTALSEIANILNGEGIESEILHIARKPISGCMACNACRKTGRCVLDDIVNEVIDKLDQYDGFVFGSPVHYAAASGFITPFLDRLFYASSGKLAYKPGAAIASCRRAGSTATLDQLNKYFTINNMPVVSSQYWNMVHGFTPEDVRKDEEGLQIMRTLGRNMAWLIKCIELGKSNGITHQYPEQRVATNFIR